MSTAYAERAGASRAIAFAPAHGSSPRRWHVRHQARIARFTRIRGAGHLILAAAEAGCIAADLERHDVAGAAEWRERGRLLREAHDLLFGEACDGRFCEAAHSTGRPW